MATDCDTGSNWEQRSLIDKLAQLHPPMYASEIQGVVEYICGSAPDKRTIERRAKAAREHHTNEPAKAIGEAASNWHPSPYVAPEDARAILESTIAFKSPSFTPSRDLARWIAWIRRGWPEMPARMVVFVAMEYWARNANGEPTTDLDTFLGFRAWEPEYNGAYHHATREKSRETDTLPRVPPILAMLAYVHARGEEGNTPREVMALADAFVEAGEGRRNADGSITLG